MLWGSSPVHLLLEEFDEKKKTNTMDQQPELVWRILFLFYFILFLVESILLCTKSENHPEKYLAKSGYKKNMKVKFLFNIFFFFTIIIEPCIEIWQFFLLWLLKISKSPWFLALLVFDFSFWLYIARRKKKEKKKGRTPNWRIKCTKEINVPETCLITQNRNLFPPGY